MKSCILYAALGVGIFVINFGIYLYSYNKIMFPYLTEYQRMEVAPILFSNVLLGYLAAAVFIVALVAFIQKYIKLS